MAGKPITMHQIKQIIELLNKNYSVRSISRMSGIARNTVADYKLIMERSNISFEQLLLLDDDALAVLIYSKDAMSPTASDRWNDFQNRLSYFSTELRRRGVTRQLLWDEYRGEYPGGYSYSQFCDHLLKELKVKNAVMHFTHRPGEQMMVDFAGDALSYVDRSTGEIHSCQVLVCVLPFSNYTYVEALRSQKQEEFVSGLSSALQYMGGSPQSIKSDNLRTAVTKSSRYEPTFTEAMEFFGKYFLIENYFFKVISPRSGRNKQVDLFFVSLAEEMGTRAVGIILSGYDGDGTEGCKQIKAKGGITFSQDVSAEIEQMPLSAQVTGCVDFVMPLDKIPGQLIRLAAALKS